jgi:hypothetical protein
LDPRLGVASDVKLAPPRSCVGAAGAGRTGIDDSFVNVVD